MSVIEKTSSPYSPPKLVEFGPLHRVTRGTGGTVGDMGAMNMAMGGNMNGNMMNGNMNGNMMSDRRVKENIVRVGTDPRGFGIYLFDYKASTVGVPEGRQLGVMADEVAEIIPEAVVDGPHGYKLVNYGLLGGLTLQ